MSKSSDKYVRSITFLNQIIVEANVITKAVQALDRVESGDYGEASRREALARLHDGLRNLGDVRGYLTEELAKVVAAHAGEKDE